MRLGLAAAAVSACLVAPSAAGAASPAADPGFAVAAVDFESYFKYRLRPGERRTGSVRLISRSSKALTVILRPVDVTTAADGGLAYGSAKPRSTGAWMRVVERTVNVPAGRAVEVPFTLQVPSDAAPGDHLAGLVASNLEQLRDARGKGRKGGFSLRFLPRLAIAVQTTVPGPAASGLTVGNIGVDVRPTTTDVTVLIRNSGSKLISRTAGELTVRHDDKVLLRQKVALDAFVPGTEIQYRLPLAGVPARGSYEVVGELLPQGAAAVPVDGSATFADQEAASLKRQTGQQPVNTGLSTLHVVLLVLAAAALLGMGAALLAMRRRLDQATRLS